MRKKLENYVPKRLRPYLEEVRHDNDGYWFWFTDDVWCSWTDCGTVHEDTIAQCRLAFADCKIIQKDKPKENLVPMPGLDRAEKFYKGNDTSVVNK